MQGGDMVYTFTEVQKGQNRLELRTEGNFKEDLSRSLVFCAYKVHLAV